MNFPYMVENIDCEIEEGRPMAWSLIDHASQLAKGSAWPDISENRLATSRTLASSKPISFTNRF